MSSAIGEALAAAIAGYLVVSAAAKILRPAVAEGALIELGVSRPLARSLVAAGIMFEYAIALAIVLWPTAVLAQSACIALFGLFALLAGLALRTGRALECGCFGSLRRTNLGWAHVFQLACIVGVLGAIERLAPDWDVGKAAAVFVLVQLAAAIFLLANAAPALWRVRRARISLASVNRYINESGWPEFSGAEMEGGGY